MKSLKIGDKVLVIAGDNKGKEAKIVGIDRENHKAMLDGINLVERHMRKSYLNPAGGKKTVHVGIDMSNLKLVEAGKFVKSAVKKVDSKNSRSKAKADKSSKKAKKGAK